MPENIEHQALTIHPVELAGMSFKTKANPRSESSAIDPSTLLNNPFHILSQRGNLPFASRFFLLPGPGLVLAILAVFLSPLQAASPLRSLPSARLVPTPWADGDSFLVRFLDPDSGTEREEAFRLYAVDCMETLSAHESDRRRLLEQSRHFGVEKAALLIPEGRAATEFVKRALTRPFTVHTAFSQALGRSGKPRYYAFITLADGRDLGAELVRHGLARVKGVSRETADGVSREEYEAHLADLELTAAIERAGIWRLSNPARLAETRAAKRREDRELASIRDVPAPAGRNLDLNTASAEELTALPGIGPALASRILQGRPYQNPNDLLKVKGIGKTTLERLRPFLQPPGSGRKASAPSQLG